MKKMGITLEEFAAEDESEQETEISIPTDIVGKSVQHKTLGQGSVVNASTTAIEVDFGNGNTRWLGYKHCMEKGLIAVS